MRMYDHAIIIMHEPERVHYHMYMHDVQNHGLMIFHIFMHIDNLHCEILHVEHKSR